MKKLFTMLMSVALLATMVVGGTLATSVIGQLDFSANSSTQSTTDLIEQDIYRINENQHISINDDESPFVGNYMIGDVVDYHVTVKNISATPVFVRTVFAFENTNGLADKLHFVTASLPEESDNRTGWHIVQNDDETDFILSHEGKEYKVFYYLYKKPIDAGATSSESLQQFYFDNSVRNFNLDNYQIMVKSQAIAQSDNAEQFDFNTAVALFGEITADNHPWKETATNANK